MTKAATPAELEGAKTVALINLIVKFLDDEWEYPRDRGRYIILAHRLQTRLVNTFVEAAGDSRRTIDLIEAAGEELIVDLAAAVKAAAEKK